MRKHEKNSQSGRQGKPQTIWFSNDQSQALDSLSRERRVTKTTLIKFAVDEMLKGLQSGQLKLPLGIK